MHIVCNERLAIRYTSTMYVMYSVGPAFHLVLLNLSLNQVIKASNAWWKPYLYSDVKVLLFIDLLVKLQDK